MARPTVDPGRTVPATPFAGGTRAKYGRPGQATAVAGGLRFACPGCGRISVLPVGPPEPVGPDSAWAVTGGSLADVATLTLTPSLMDVRGCGWRGTLTAGVFLPAHHPETEPCVTP